MGQDIELGEKPEKKSDKKAKEVIPTVSYRQLFRYAQGIDYVWITLAFIGAIARGTMMPLFTVIWGDIINILGDPNPTKSLSDEMVRVGLYFVYLGAGGVFVTFLQMTGFSISSQNQAQKIRHAYLNAVLRQEIAFFDKNNTGSLVSQLSSDTVIIQEALGEKLGTAIQAFTNLICGFIIGFYYGWKLTLVTISTLPLIMLGGALMVYSANSLTSKGQAAYSQAASIANEALGGIRTVASFCAEKLALTAYVEKLKPATAAGIKRGFLSGVSIGFNQFIFNAAFALCLWYGAKLVAGDDYTGGDIMKILFGVTIGGYSLGTAAQAVETLSKGRGAAYKVFSIIDRKSEIDPLAESGVPLDHVEGSVEIESVEFRYPTRSDVKVLDKVSISIKPGQTVALVGQSGSGKSSIIGLIQRFYNIEGGRISIDGKDIKDINLRSLRSQLGLVSQEPILFSGTIVENIRYGKMDATQDEIEAAARAANAHNFITEFPDGYNTFIGERGAQLSGGQKQRIAIARAIVKNPKILLLDEATSALDNESERIVQDALDKVMKGRTTIVIAHRLSTIRNADNIVVLNHGVIVEEGTHEELMSKDDVYAELVKLQGLEAHTQQKDTSTKGSLSPKKARSEVSEKVATTEQPEDEDDNISEGEKKEAEKVSIFKLLTLNKPEFPVIAGGVFAAMVNGTMQPVWALLMAEIIAVYFKPLDRIEEDIAPWVIAFVILGVVCWVAIFFQYGLFGFSGEKLTSRIRELTFEKMLRYDIGWHDDIKHNSGILSSRLARDATQVESLVGTRLGFLTQISFTIIIGIGIALYYGWKLALVVLSLSPVMAMSSILQMATLKKGNHDAADEANQVASEAISNIRTVASFTNENLVSDRYYIKISAAAAHITKKAIIRCLLLAVSESVTYVAYFISFWYGGKLIEDGELSFTSMMKVFLGIMLTAMSIGETSVMFPNVSKAKIAAVRVFKLLDDQSSIDPFSPEGDDKFDIKGNVSLKEVKFSYPTRKDTIVLNHLSLQAPAGQVVALVGQSGCGKSSVVSLLERFYDIDGGAILIDDTPIEKINIKTLRQQVGFVGQEPVLFSGTIAENIKYGKPEANQEEVEAAARAANAHNFITEFPDGYNTFIGERGAQLSGGQKQRIAIARAIVKNPKILLLDEATSALDTESERIVQDALDKVMKGRTTIVIAHRLSTIKNADLIIVMDKGRVIESGTHNELLELQGAYYNLVSKS